MMPSEMKRMRELEEENNRLKRIVADLSLDRAMLEDVIKRNVWSAPRLQGDFWYNDIGLRKCIQPLASGLRLQPGHDEISTRSS